MNNSSKHVLTIIIGISLIIIISAFGNELANKSAPDNSRFVNYNISLGRLIDSLRINKDSLRLFIQKSKYTLSVTYKRRTIKSYPVVFGFNPVDDKLREGDGCTPEGVFHIKTKYPHKSWSKFIWIDYPNADSWKKHNEAKARGKIPANSKIGGEVGIHGVPKGYDYAIDLKMNWTLGCISLKNKDIDEIYAFVTTKTLVEITR